MVKIKITCEGCSKTHEVNRDNEAPKDAVSMGCNWCPDCEDSAEDYYEEWYNTGGDSKESSPDIPDNQLMMPFIFDEIGINESIEILK